MIARRQGLLNRTVKSRDPIPWETLAGFSAPAKLWESEFFPGRCEDYRGEFLDREIREGRLVWYGTGKEKTGFCAPEDLDLALPVPEKSAPQKNAITETLPASFFDIPRSYWQIKEAVDKVIAGHGAILNSAEITAAIWKSVWQGFLSADTWEPVRRAIMTGFKNEGSEGAGPKDIEAETSQPLTVNPFGRTGMRIPRTLRERWKGGPPVQGNWFSLASEYDEMFGDQDGADDPALPGDENPWEKNPLAEDELNRARVRLLLKRFGFLCRPLLEHETPAFSWSKLLPGMRRMELAGELVAGRFFGGINSLQFAPPGIARDLDDAEGEEGIYWMNAADPASPCGVPALTSLYENEKIKFPARLPSSRICFKGMQLIAVSTKNGKEMEVDPSFEKNPPRDLLDFICFPRRRFINPEKKIEIEKINGISAASSVMADKLKDEGFVNDRGKLVLW